MPGRGRPGQASEAPGDDSPEGSAAHPWLHIEVSDTGIGIDPAGLPRIFGAFEQGHRDITQQFGGLGLGLAIRKAIVDLDGGTITAASDGRDHGSRYTLRLPFVEASEPAASLPRTETPSMNGEIAAEFSGHLLLVEDHADTANIMACMLRWVNFGVTMALSCAQALPATLAAQKEADASGRSRPIRLVICDLGLPEGRATISCPSCAANTVCVALRSAPASSNI